MDANNKPRVMGEIELVEDNAAAESDLTEPAKFALMQLQGSANMARRMCEATVFTIVALPTASGESTRMLSFAMGCECPACLERSNVVTKRLLEVVRDSGPEFQERVAFAHAPPASDTPQ
jgi:hypothetical protein